MVRQRYNNRSDLQIQNQQAYNDMEKRNCSDEHYIIDLLDDYLGLKAERQKTFDFLRGDPSPNRQGRKLPVDAFYPSLCMAVEYHERQHSESVKHFDKPDKITVSGVHRGKQRLIYDQRRQEILPLHSISLVLLKYSEFKLKRKRLLRTDSDKMVIARRFRQWIPASAGMTV